MATASFLTSHQHEEFTRWGILRLAGLLRQDTVRRARDFVFDRLAAIGVSEAAGWRLTDGDVDQKTAEGLGADHPEISALEQEPRLVATVDELLGYRPRLDRSRRLQQLRPQALITLPSGENWYSNSKAWRIPKPNMWHVDAQRLPSGRSLGVQIFGFLDTVMPGGGGTLAVAGSHRLLNDGRYIGLNEIGDLLRQEDFFRRLYTADAEELAGAMAQPCLVNGFEQKVVELTGEPGDAYVTDLRVLHCRALNLGDRPRVMITQRFYRADLLQEVRDHLSQVSDRTEAPAA